ncbi:PREDICTED: uncharacterized protein LOC108567332 isoform X3 [Nicrophorus vespilloides]|uniref:Uncharacterized protein LOC108567332 isoform X2 n=1 Tax=Nicrophorus vespilloides TaxID=110193 RepID=A0ABM1N8R8_NICVS|nr:PREDICTED: uncharacterized protein LOC108567332 isoform X2 [Nicrophorus vespilloides]XP_017783218.1 PREDICTED: uncharacterized protein LOC108567332 isoform X3 [Nicrophorus vespilloides]
MLFFTVASTLCFYLSAASHQQPKKTANVLNNSQQNIHNILVSIEERLRNLDNALYTDSYELTTKPEQTNNRKLDAIESRLARFEAVVAAQFDKFAENMSNKVFSDDLARDHVHRKIDGNYDRINHRLFYLEMRLDSGEKRISEKLDLLLTRFKNMEETLTTREADIEVEISDVLSVVDDIKTTFTSLDFKNISKTFKTTQRSLERTLNESIKEISKKENALAESFNEYTDKVSEMFEVSQQYSKSIQNDLKTLSAVVNSTRSEQQNSLRSIIVQVGRLSGKPNVLSDGQSDSELRNLSDKLDANFEMIMMLQNQFLESCHRVQMDEAHIETKISEILEKLIETFERKTSIELKDLKLLEQLLKAHDTKVQNNLYTTSQILIRKSLENKDELKTLLGSIKVRIDKICSDVDNIKRKKDVDLSGIQQKLLALEEYLKESTEASKNMGAPGVLTEKILSDIQSSIHQLSSSALWQSVVNEKGFLNIEDSLRNITNTFESAQNEAFEALKNIEKYLLQNNDTNVPTNNYLDEQILKIFGLPKPGECTEFTINSETGEKICMDDIQEENCLDYDIDVRSNAKNCKPKLPEPDCLEYDIDVRSNVKICKNKTNESNANCNNMGIDVRTGQICDNSELGNIPNNTDDCSEDPLIDIRGGNTRARNCSNVNNTTEESILFFTRSNVINDTNNTLSHDNSSDSMMQADFDQSIKVQSPWLRILPKTAKSSALTQGQTSAQNGSSSIESIASVSSNEDDVFLQDEYYEADHVTAKFDEDDDDFMIE